MKSKDYRVIINHTRHKDESPTKTRLLDMHRQFNLRDCGTRMLRYGPNTSPADTRTSSIDNIDEVLVADIDGLLDDAFDGFLEDFENEDTFNQMLLNDPHTDSFVFEENHNL